MDRLLVSDNDILHHIGSRVIFNRGKMYYLENRVRNFQLQLDSGILEATVSGTQLYNVEVTFTKTGKINNSWCNCPAYSNYRTCKHIVAVLKTAQNKYRGKKLVAQDNPFKIATEIINLFAGRSREPQKTEVQVEIHLTLHSLTFGLRSSMELKIGLERLYVVRDVEAFLEALAKGIPFEFGKRFTFEPDRHTFQTIDLNIINFLQEILAQEQPMDSYYDSNVIESVFKGKLVTLNGFNLKKMLTLLKNRPFFLNFIPEPTVMTSIQDNLPVNFSVEANGNDLSLLLTNENLPVPLVNDGSYFYHQGIIYRASEEQQKYLFPLLVKYLDKNKNLIFPSTCKDLFVTEVLPYIRKISSVDIAPSLEETFCEEALTAKIYFDKPSFTNDAVDQEDGIAALIEFHYGEKIIKPFSPISEKSNLSSTEKIIIRDSEKEHQIFELLEQAEFTVKQGQIHLSDNDKVFNFITSILPKLQELAEVYYSENFRGLQIRASTSLSGRVRLDEGQDLLEFSCQIDDIDKDELEDIFQSLKLKKKYYRLKDGSFIDFNQSQLHSIATLLENLNLSVDDIQQKIIQLPKYRAMYIDNFLRQNNLQGIGRNRAFKQLVQSIQEPQDMEYDIPDQLQPVLREYQKTGFKWLKTLAAYGLGGILADDMGLGKTLQVISLILSEKHIGSLPSLVIAPTSLVYNWFEEVTKFVPELNVVIISGTPQERQDKLEAVKSADIVITSYPLIRRDIDLYEKTEFNYCFLDEAQHIKNPNTINARSVQQIKARNYFALTGTPVENSLTELWSIFNFVMPGYLHAHNTFQKKYELPIVRDADCKALQELSRHVRPFVLRRLKKDVLKELPDKIETKMIAEMTDQQKKIYLAFLNKAKADIANEISAVGFEKSRIKILALLTRLRQICCHPALFVDDYKGESGKLQLLQEVLEDAISSGHRILLFSQFTSMLSIISEQLIKQKIDHLYLDGNTKAEKRLELVRAFNDGTGAVFLVSLKAGGTGLNLTGADMVIHFDPWWNPAVEQQATDRTHRIGQKKVVQVMKLITRGTIEEKIYILQQKKKELIDAVVQTGETFLSKMTEEELVSLFD